jgi:hypothetical protein
MSSIDEVDFCEYISKLPLGSIPYQYRICPVPKVKGIYYPTQEEFYKKFSNENCYVTKKLPGTLGKNPHSHASYISTLISKNSYRTKGKTQFVKNGNNIGIRAGQPGGIPPPIRNKF